MQSPLTMGAPGVAPTPLPMASQSPLTMGAPVVAPTPTGGVPPAAAYKAVPPAGGVCIIHTRTHTHYVYVCTYVCVRVCVCVYVCTHTHTIHTYTHTHTHTHTQLHTPAPPVRTQHAVQKQRPPAMATVQSASTDPSPKTSPRASSSSSYTPTNYHPTPPSGGPPPSMLPPSRATPNSGAPNPSHTHIASAATPFRGGGIVGLGVVTAEPQSILEALRCANIIGLLSFCSRSRLH